MSDDWLEHGKELTRKTSQELQRWIHANDAGIVDTLTLFRITSALYHTTSGLVDDDLMTLLSNIHADLRRQLVASGVIPE